MPSGHSRRALLTDRNLREEKLCVHPNHEAYCRAPSHTCIMYIDALRIPMREFLMNLYYPTFGAVVLLVLLTTILAVQNFLRAGALARSVSALEDEVEKRGREFDSLRKQDPTTTNVLPVTQATENDVDMTSSAHAFPSESGSEQFEIVRNIRAGFEQLEESHLEQQTVDVQPHDNEPQPDASQVRSVPVSPAPAPYAAGTVRLYSPVYGKADFHRAWDTLKQILSSHDSHETLVFDCSGLENLTVGEISYLERFVQVAQQSDIRSTIVGCTPNLIQILKSRPSLAQLTES